MKKRFILSAGLCFIGMLFGISAYAADDAADMHQEVFEAVGCGVEFTIPDEYKTTRGTIEYLDFGDDYMHGAGIVEMTASYYPMNKEEYDRQWEEVRRADEEDDIDTVVEMLFQMRDEDLFRIYGINKDRGVDELIGYFLDTQASVETEQFEDAPSKEMIEARRERILSRRYSEIGSCDGFTYILVTEDPEPLKNAEPFRGYENGYYEEYLSLLENTALITENVRLTGGVVLTDPVELAKEGSGIHFEAADLDGNPVRSEDLFAGHAVTMINLWGTWCSPCIRELPELEEMNQEFAEKNCQIIGIVTDADSDEKIREAKEILAEKGVTYINLAAFEGLSDLLPQDSWPTSYFVDENGNLIGEPVSGALPDRYRERIN